MSPAGFPPVIQDYLTPLIWSSRCGISWNAYQICRHESNHHYPRWMCSAWDGS